jgi:hypothetical protein
MSARRYHYHLASTEQPAPLAIPILNRLLQAGVPPQASDRAPRIGLARLR